ncbi:hypothetical protein [Sporosarcina sp. NPDC096371]|uniref:hypothetical protein n=1 Tax=Sporosarcina sp. NPDC096371 TaxID=3364530 RepID=UPI003822B651
MIPEEIENRIATYYFHRYLPDEVMEIVVNGLLTRCLKSEDEEIDVDEIVFLAIHIIDQGLDR